MKKYKLQTEFSAYSSLEELPESARRILEAAREARENSYSPYSNFKVGAAVLLQNGEVLSGSNYENASYPVCICAEQTTLTTAANLFPNVPVLALAITVRNPRRIIDRPGPPCGVCRQVICETEMKYGQDMQVIFQGETGPIFIFKSGKDLLPLAFDQSYL